MNAPFRTGHGGRIARDTTLTFTFNADLPGELDDMPDGSKPPMTWTVPIDGTAAELTVVSRLSESEGSDAWGLVANIALIAWCVIAVAFITFVWMARRRRAQRRRTA